MVGAASLHELLQRTVDCLQTLLQNTCTGVLQIQPDRAALDCVAFACTQPFDEVLTVPLDLGLIGACARLDQTILANDTARYPRFVPARGWVARSELCVPIRTRQGLWGVLILDSDQTQAYPPQLVQLAEIIAQQLGVAVDNTALVGQARDQTQLLERHARELAQILALNSRLRVSTELEPLLQELAESIRVVLGFQSVIVNLVDVSRNHVWVAAMAGCTPEEEALLRDATYAWDTFLGDEPERYRVSHSYFIPAEAGYVSPGITITPQLGERASDEWQANDMLMIPIANQRGEVLGVLSVDDPKDRQRPSMATLQGLEIFAAQVAAAIENAHLFAQAQSALRALREAHERQAQLLDDVRRTQAELITSSRLASIGTLAAGVAHEFNNLLAGMHGYAELAQGGTQPDKDEALEIIRRTCLRGVQITRSLLTFARQGDGQREMARIDEIADSALQLISRDLAKHNVTVVRDYRARTVIWADAGQIIQVVLNLLTNARDAMQPGGTITITIHDRDNWIELAVADTGSGIPAAIRDRIFEPFVTTKGPLGGSTVAGNGLGLSVSYGIVRDHGGQLLVESAEGQGSCFTLCLPHSQGAAPPPPPPIAQQPRRILVVDDEAQVRLMLVALLSRAGHKVVQASDGQDVLDRCQSEQWELIVSDMTMPRLDGPDMIKALREQGITTPVILITGRVDGEGLSRARGSDACAVLAKPFEAATLLSAVSTAMGE
jgi:signal transduction histidine kinase